MCGIAGFIDRDGTLDSENLKGMIDTLRRRGPDGDGCFVEGQFGIGMRRLAIIDLNGGWQPIFNEDKSVVVVLNGEIYNYKSLAAELTAKGHTFTTHSDTEVLVHLYEEYDAELVSHLEGMFSFAILDRAKGRMILARDHLGIKPLFLASFAGGYAFASEIKALMTLPNISREIDESAAIDFLRYGFIPAPRTIYSQIKKVHPGTVVTFESGCAPRYTCYWRPEPKPQAISVEDAAEELSARLIAAVDAHMVSDVPVASLLSGGIDSGVVTALAARSAKYDMEAFTARFVGAGSRLIDERPYARQVAQRYGIRLHEIDISSDFTSQIDDIVDAFDEPFADDSMFPTMLISKAVSCHFKVVLSGLGGDELFGGYTRHLGIKILGAALFVPAAFWRSLNSLASLVHPSSHHGQTLDRVQRWLTAAQYPLEMAYEKMMCSISDNEARQLFREYGSLSQPVMAERVRSFPSGSVLDRVLATDLGIYMPDDVLALSDRLSMWNSLEMRVPFLDRQLVEFSMRLPGKLKITGLTQKAILRQVASRWLPADVLTHAKQGFESPMEVWIKQVTPEQFDWYLAAIDAACPGLLNGSAVRELLARHGHGREDKSRILFSVIMLGAWARRFGRSGGA